MARRLALVGAVVGSVALAACALSEWRAIAWWSPVKGIGASPYQDFWVFARGELRIGHRSTAGFFTRAIPASGWHVQPPRRVIMHPPHRVWMAWRYQAPQHTSYILPLTPIAGTIAGVSLAHLVVRRRGPHQCPVCGYDLRGSPAGPCPECGSGR